MSPIKWNLPGHKPEWRRPEIRKPEIEPKRATGQRSPRVKAAAPDGGKQTPAPVVQPTADVQDANPQNQLELPGGAPAFSKDVAVVAADQTAIEITDTPPTIDGPVHDPIIVPGAAGVANNEGRNGDETDARMEEIEKILGHAALPVLDKSELTAEWVRHAEAKVSGFGQVVINPRGGRPEGGVTRAARELPVRGKTLGARKKIIERAIDIDAILPEAKIAVRAAKLDNNQKALLAIAEEKSLEAQLGKVKEIADRRAAPRKSRKAQKQETAGSSAALAAHDPADLFELSKTAHENWTAEDGRQFDALLQTWLSDGVLRQAEWQKASAITRRRFAGHVLFGANDVEVDPANQTPLATEFSTAPAEEQATGPASADASADMPTSSSEQPW
jgi:hypothetical protein